MNACLAQCDIRHVLTSRRMLDSSPLKLDAELVYLDELKTAMTLVRQAAGRRVRLAAARRRAGARWALTRSGPTTW